ncbi:anti-sigma factor [Nonomuraea endophytica]|uniref:Regulator of SigK n=1 Tax=Nonomuraea endophytica TaxID=714136 RepID=A0A7W8AD01_9ACTN|nr:anti-sigma factor [Nonomuraea endophytica]MBB5083984.1 anti-sigma-K factor RskA [Nonomuraea endophytica]
MKENTHTLSGAYALNALPEEQAREFERHLARCPDCAEETRGLCETTARMAAAVRHEPPSVLKARVMEEIGAVRQASPIVPATMGRSSRPHARLLAGRAAAALLVAAALVLGVLLIRTNGQLNEERVQGDRIAAVLAAPDARQVSTRVGAATVTAIYSPAKASVVVVTAGMPTAPAAHDYQVWLIGPDAIRSAGLMPDRPGPVLAGPVHAGDKLGITVEPQGGSRQPTTQPLTVVALTS